MSRRVLLTGANGYIAQHILAAFLEAGHSVRGVVRSEAKAAQLSSIFKDYVPSQLDFGVVPDIAAPGAFDAVLESTPPFDTVIHSASPFNYRKNTSNAEFLDPAVKGTTGILESIAARAPSVRRVVLTSSMAAIIDFGADKFSSPAKIYTEADWNPTTWEDALSTTNMGTVYQASKKYAEKAAWAFVDREKPGFDLVVLNPPSVYGPMVDPSIFASPSELPESVFTVQNNLLRAGLTAESDMPATRLHLYLDVRDLAQAHLLAATVPAAGGQRFVICAEQGNMSMQRMANLLRERLPEVADRVPVGNPAQESLGEGVFGASSQKAMEVLGLRFRTPAETIGDVGAQLVSLFKE